MLPELPSNGTAERVAPIFSRRAERWLVGFDQGVENGHMRHANGLAISFSVPARPQRWCPPMQKVAPRLRADEFILDA